MLRVWLQVLRSLGAGAFGTAWLAKHSQNGKEYALKVSHRYMHGTHEKSHQPFHDIHI